MERCSVVVGWPLGANKASVGSAGPLRRQPGHASIRRKCLCEVPVSSPPVLPLLILPAPMKCSSVQCTYCRPHERTAGASGIAELRLGRMCCAVQ